MSFPINAEEQEFDKKIKEISQITYSTDTDTSLIRNLVRVVMIPPLLVADTARFIDQYGSVVVKIEAVDDDCHTWVDEGDSNCKNGPDTVLFVYLTPAQPGAQKEEIKEVLRKIQALSTTS